MSRRIHIYRRIRAAIQAIHSLSVSKASLSVDSCRDQCNAYFDGLLGHLRLLYPIRCILPSLKRTAACYNKTIQDNEFKLIQDILTIPLTGRLFELADFFKLQGRPDLFYTILASLERRPLNTFLMHLAGSYASAWGIMPL